MNGSSFVRIGLGVSIGVVAFALGRWSARMANESRVAEARPAKIEPATVARRGSDTATFTKEATGAGEAKPAERASLDLGEWRKKWAALAAQAGSSARGTAMADLLTQLAETDPAQAMTLAQAEGNLVLREMLVQGVLRGWGRTAPADAVKWVYSLPDQAKRSAAMATVLASAAAAQPEEAARIGRTFFQQDVGGATGYVGSLIEGLCANGRYELAVQLAGESAAVGPVSRSILTTQVYAAWATMQPEQAAQAAAALTDPTARTDAMNAVVSGWGQVDPAGLTEFVAHLPPGPEQVPLLGQALRQWATADAAAALQWAASHDVGGGVDDGVAAVAGAGFLQPGVSAEWAESIANPALRSHTLLSVLRNWAITDPEGARRYFEAAKPLEPADQAQAAAIFAPPNGG